MRKRKTEMNEEQTADTLVVDSCQGKRFTDRMVLKNISLNRWGIRALGLDLELARSGSNLLVAWTLVEEPRKSAWMFII